MRSSRYALLLFLPILAAALALAGCDAGSPAGLEKTAEQAPPAEGEKLRVAPIPDGERLLPLSEGERPSGPGRKGPRAGATAADAPADDLPEGASRWGCLIVFVWKNKRGNWKAIRTKPLYACTRAACFSRNFASFGSMTVRQ